MFSLSTTFLALCILFYLIKEYRGLAMKDQDIKEEKIKRTRKGVIIG